VRRLRATPKATKRRARSKPTVGQESTRSMIAEGKASAAISKGVMERPTAMMRLEGRAEARLRRVSKTLAMCHT
jgi:hypothetical protein